MDLVDPNSLILPDQSTDIPRLRFDTALISRMARAIDLNDGQWPEAFNADGGVITDEDDLVLSGVHRVVSARKRNVEEIPRTIKTFESVQDKLLFVIAANAAHGKAWSPKEESEITIICEKFGIEQKQIALALQVPLAVIEKKPIVNITQRKSRGPVIGKTYVPRPVRKRYKNVKSVSAHEAEVMAAIVSPLAVRHHLADLLRIGELDALPLLDLESYTLARASIELLQNWIDRDSALLEESA